MPDEIDLSSEEEEALDRAWAKIEQEGRLQHGSPAAPPTISPGGEQRRYPEPKQRELTDDEKDQIRQRIVFAGLGVILEPRGGRGLMGLRVQRGR